MTKVFYIDCEKGASYIVFAVSVDQAAEIFTCWRIARGLDHVSFAVGRWIAYLNATEKRHLDHALGSSIIGMGFYDEITGWRFETPGG